MNISIFNNLIRLVFILSLSLIVFSCGEDDTPPAQSTNDMLDGTWLASSYILDGTETIGSINSALELTFAKSTPVTGTFTAKTTDASMTTSTASSTYDVVDDGDRIKIGTDTLDMTLSGSSLNLEGVFFFPSPNSQSTISLTKQ